MVFISSNHLKLSKMNIVSSNYSSLLVLGRRILKWNLTCICPSSLTSPRNITTTTSTGFSKTYNGAAAAAVGGGYSYSSISESMEQAMLDYFFGRKKITEVAHCVWTHVVRKGDTVVDATCGNGYDTLAMLRMVADETQKGRVYGMDVQKIALESTSSLLNQLASPDEKELVELFAMCHSQIEDVVPNDVAVRLVAFNLGYLPGGDKKIITSSETTVLALDAAKRILAPGGLISIVAYVGHPGGREEFEKIEGFASRLPFESWNCCKLQMLNRPLAPILMLLFKR